MNRESTVISVAVRSEVVDLPQEALLHQRTHNAVNKDATDLRPVQNAEATQKTQQPDGFQTRTNYSLGISSYPTRPEQRSSTSPTGYQQPIRIEDITHRGEQSTSNRIAENSSASQAAVSSTLSPLISSGTNATISWLDSILDDTAIPLVSSANLGVVTHGGLESSTLYGSDQAQLLSLESPIGTYKSAPGQTETANGHQSEEITSWANMSHFIALFLRYLYPLMPLVHRPTFAEQLATRRDLVDKDFRALLLSIVAYVISQLPTSRLVNEKFDIEALKSLQRKCHRTCRALQRTCYGPTTCTQISTIIFDTFYLLSIGLGHTASARLGHAIQLAFSMGMHSDEKTDALGLDPIEVQLRRRVFWQLYATDKTRAISDLPMMINDFQGVCSLPEPVDDEFITIQGSFLQPTSRPSAICGFIAVSKLFKILSECLFHHRCIMAKVQLTDTACTETLEDRLQEVLRDFPDGSYKLSGNNDGIVQNMLAVQRANILITAAICKFALYDLRASLQSDKEQLAKEREAIAREIHSSLMNIPLEDLASNGESVRSKIFHIVCALCDQKPTGGVDHGLICDWYSMFSTISFVQMPPPPPEDADDGLSPK
ncbi:hypothetical protein V866_001883 [Kwoniella sp. B9012]